LSGVHKCLYVLDILTFAIVAAERTKMTVSFRSIYRLIYQWASRTCGCISCRFLNAAKDDINKYSF
jgi:hypothetical protein